MASPLPCAQRISAVVPCYNEEDCVARAYAEISAVLADFADYEIIFVDDGSSDATLDLIKQFARTDPRVRYISFTRNFGLEAAFSAGFRYAQYPWTVQFDADLQSPPTELPKLMAKSLEGFDVVFAMRIQRRDPRYRRWGSNLQHWLARCVFRIELPHRGSIFRVVRSSVAKKIVALNLGTPYFLATVALVGARYTSVPTEHRPRLAGRGKWNLRKLFAHTVELYTGFSFRFFTLVYWIAAASAIAAAAVAVSTVLGGLPASMVTALTLAAIAGLAIDAAIISRYLVRIIRGQSRGPSRYLVRESNVDLDPSESLYEFEIDQMRPRPQLIGVST